MSFKFWKSSPLPKRDISEPVAAFLRTFRDNPRRFSLNTLHGGWRYGMCSYIFKDKQNGEEWKIQARHNLNLFEDDNGVALKLPDWLTKDEVTAITIFMVTHYTKRAERLKAIQTERSTRHLNHERKRLINIYCKGEI
jgi:hypothetical protein